VEVCITPLWCEIYSHITWIGCSIFCFKIHFLHYESLTLAHKIMVRVVSWVHSWLGKLTLVILLLTLDLGTRWGEWSVSHPGRALPAGKGPPVPVGQEAGWASELVWIQRLQEKFIASAGDQTLVAQSSCL
jgi:hypothetical protein